LIEAVAYDLAIEQ